MFNPSALGVALLVLLAATTMVRSPTPTFRVTYGSLGDLIANANAGPMIGSYQRQTNTLSLSRDSLRAPHRLTVTVSPGANLRGTITVNDTTQLALNATTTVVDLSPYLTQTPTTITIVGDYSPPSASVSVVFQGPDTQVQQQVGGTGHVNYQLNLLIE